MGGGSFEDVWGLGSVYRLIQADMSQGLALLLVLASWALLTFGGVSSTRGRRVRFLEGAW